jgi:hypothetical protein
MSTGATVGPASNNSAATALPMSRTEIICSGTSFGNGIGPDVLHEERRPHEPRWQHVEQKLLTRRLLSKWGTPPGGQRRPPRSTSETTGWRLQRRGPELSRARSPLGSAGAVKGCHGERRRSATEYRAHRRDRVEIGGHDIDPRSRRALPLALSGCRVTARTATPATSSASATAAPTRTGPRGIPVNNIQPGPTATDMKPDDGGEFADHMRSLTAVGHYGHPGDIANAIAELIPHPLNRLCAHQPRNPGPPADRSMSSPAALCRPAPSSKSPTDTTTQAGEPLMRALPACALRPPH